MLDYSLEPDSVKLANFSPNNKSQFKPNKIFKSRNGDNNLSSKNLHRKADKEKMESIDGILSQLHAESIDRNVYSTNLPPISKDKSTVSVFKPTEVTESTKQICASDISDGEILEKLFAKLIKRIETDTGKTILR